MMIDEDADIVSLDLYSLWLVGYLVPDTHAAQASIHRLCIFNRVGC